MAESDAGRTIEPGKPDDSLFLDLLVESNEPTGRMPKNADPLPAAEVATLRRWIEQGAEVGGLDPDADLAGLVARANRPKAPAAYRAPVPISALAFRPDGGELAVGGYHEVTIWDPSTGKLLRRIPGLAQRTQGLALQRRRLDPGRRGRDARRVGRAGAGRPDRSPADPRRSPRPPT